MTLSPARVRLIERRIDDLAKELSAFHALVSGAGTAGRSGKTGQKYGPAGSNGVSSLVAYLALGSAIHADKTLNRFLECAMAVVAAGGAGMTLYDPIRERLVFRAAIGDGAKGIIGQEVPLRGSVHGFAFASGDLQNTTPKYKKIEKAAGVQFTSVLVAPLLVDGEPIGTMSVVNKHGGSCFNDMDEEAFKNFSDLAGLLLRQRAREESLRVALLEGKTPAKVKGNAKKSVHAVLDPRVLSGLEVDRELFGLMRDLAGAVIRKPSIADALRRMIQALD